MSSLYRAISFKKNIELKDICHIQEYLNALIQNKKEALNGMLVKNKFPLEKDLQKKYIEQLNHLLMLGKEHLLKTILQYMNEDDQVFETEVQMAGDLGYIRYLFPIPYVKELINQGGFKPQQVDTHLIYGYTQYIELDKTYIPKNKEPISVLQYPYASPGFFVLDGNHRVYQAYKKNIEQIEAYLLSEGAIPLLAPDRIFATLYDIHKNLVAISMYMVGEISLKQLKQIYQPIVDEKWII